MADHVPRQRSCPEGQIFLGPPLATGPTSPAQAPSRVIHSTVSSPVGRGGQGLHVDSTMAGEWKPLALEEGRRCHPDPVPDKDLTLTAKSCLALPLQGAQRLLPPPPLNRDVQLYSKHPGRLPGSHCLSTLVSLCLSAGHAGQGLSTSSTMTDPAPDQVPALSSSLARPSRGRNPNSWVPITHQSMPFCSKHPGGPWWPGSQCGHKHGRSSPQTKIPP
ncbi:uncharacterized protein LOC144382863 isoform X2 [Halichoerus grypus]